jgi:flagellar motility protein MotE (MotC chaperone)
MKKSIVLLGGLALLMLGSASYAEGERPYIGLQLDPSPLPELLTKHLGLEAGQGVRISNIAVGSPADKAGLERDDIVVAFQGKAITSPDEFVAAVGKSGAGAKVSLDVIHLGQRKTLDLELVPLPAETKMKYPPEPEAVTTWRPGKVFKIGPGGQGWMEIPFDKMPNVNFDVKKFLQETYTYHHSTDGEDYTVTIEGSPKDEQSRVIVEAGDAEYSTTVGKLDVLPEKYRDAAKEAIENACKNMKKDIRIERRFRWPQPPSPDVYRKYFEAIPRPDLEQWSQQKDRILEKLQQEMSSLQQRMQELEQHHREMLDKLLERKEIKKEEMKQDQPDKPASLEPEQQKTI